MIDSLAVWYGVAISLVIGVLSSFSLYTRWRKGLLLTAAGGLHLNALVFFAVGGLCYSWFGAAFGSLPHELAMSYFPKVGGAFLLGYALWVFIEYRQFCSLKKVAKEVQEVEHFSLEALAFLSGLAFLGYFLSAYEIALSGAGTIFPVLKNFFYPALLLCILRVSRHDPPSIFLAAFILATAGYYAIFSPWRSEMILVSSCLWLAWILRAPQAFFPALITFLIGFLLLLPFANYKKIHYEEFRTRPYETFTLTLKMEMSERVDFTAQFFGARINSVREMIYVQNGLDAGLTNPRRGESYWEAVQQLVPRDLWPGKPSFNFNSGYMLPRQIGLLGWDDPGTSWGVNPYAEFIWNFGYLNLIWFVPLFFLLASGLDLLANWILTSLAARRFAKVSLFFLTFQTTSGTVNIMTYILWTFILIRLFGPLLVDRMKQEGPFSMPKKTTLSLAPRDTVQTSSLGRVVDHNP